MKILIFSKDRACQLNALLSSFQRNWPSLDFNSIVVLYTYSNSRFQEGYEILKDKFAHKVMFDKETDFGCDLLINLIDTHRSVGFFTDDCVVYRKIEIDATFIDNMLADEQNLCISLRLGVENSRVQNYLTGELHKSIKEYGATNINYKQMFKYRWGLFPPQSNPGYIGSIDGCFYDSQYVIDTLKNVTAINCPRSLEENLANNQAWRQKMMAEKLYMICPRFSNVVVNSINAVQTDAVACGQNFSYTPEMLNDIYLEDNVIDLDDLLAKCDNIEGCHTELPLTFKKYEENKFSKYLEEASKEVKTWPEWKQNILGGIK